MTGWISIYRDIREHWIWQDPVKFKWWMDILLSVNHTSSKVNIGMQLFECQRGQSIMSLQSWADRWSITKDSTRNFFVLLERDGMIKTENLKKTTRITVCNYETYQTDLHAGQTPAKRQPNASQTLDYPNNKGNNENNENNDNKMLPPPKIDNKVFDEVIELYHKSCEALPKVSKITTQRKSAINARIKEHGIDGIKKMLDNVSGSEFLQGNNDKNWTPNFDWLFKSDKFIKVLEGNYNNKQNDKNGNKRRMDKREAARPATADQLAQDTGW